LFAFWFNTGFVDDTNILEIKKEELDKAHKDRSHKTYKENFKVICHFTPLDIGGQTKYSNTNTIENHNNVDELDVLNGIKRFIQPLQSRRSACEISQDLLKQAIEVTINQDSSNTGIVNTIQQLQEIKDSNAFKAFALSTCELQQVVLEESHEEKLCFWINVYNLLLVHGYISSPPEKNATIESKWNFFKKTKYNIGGSVYSLADIQFGILRSKMTTPQTFQNNLGDLTNSSIHLHGLNKSEPRIDFALSWATKSSASLIIYHAGTIFEELENSTRNFLQKNIIINSESKEIIIPELISWFHIDFADTDERALSCLINYLTTEQKNSLQQQQKNAKIITSPFSWEFQFSFTHLISDK